MKTQITIDDSHQIIADYKNGATISDLTKTYPYSYYTIDCFLQKQNLKTVKHNKRNQQKIQQIIQLLQLGYGTTYIKQQVKTDANTIRVIANEYKINKQRQMPSRASFNSNFKDDYFSIIDTEAKAYYLGLLYTDGNVRIHNNGYFVALSLNNNDKYIIEQFAQEINCGNNIRVRNKVTNFSNDSLMAEFCTCNSKQMFDDLGRFNIIPNKTYDSQSFNNVKNLIPKELWKHFLRGLIDGDGSLYHKNRAYCIQIVNYNKQFCIDVNDLLQELFNNTLTYDIRQKPNQHLYQLRYRRKDDVYKISKLLYENSTVKLDRKYKAYLNIERGMKSEK